MSYALCVCLVFYSLVANLKHGQNGWEPVSLRSVTDHYQLSTSHSHHFSIHPWSISVVYGRIELVSLARPLPSLHFYKLTSSVMSVCKNWRGGSGLASETRIELEVSGSCSAIVIVLLSSHSMPWHCVVLHLVRVHQHHYTYIHTMQII